MQTTTQQPPRASHLIASQTPLEAIESLPRRPEQPATMREYRAGYEGYFNSLPSLHHDDPLLPLKVEIAGTVMRTLAAHLKKEDWPFELPEPGQFKRKILAIADPEYCPLREGSEILVAQWGKGFSSPVHGHASGLLHEDILSGKILVNNYRWVRDNVVRIVSSQMAGPGTLISSYAPPDEKGPRMGLIHNFIAVEPSASLHYVAEHTRDGRDNRFEVESFPIRFEHLHQIESNIEAMRTLRIGDVCLVRSQNVAEFGDHYIVITGGLVLKPWGMRPQDVEIAAPETKPVLDRFQPSQMGLILLKLTPKATEAFHEFHGIKCEGGQVTFPRV